MSGNKKGRFAENTEKMPSIFDNRPKWFKVQAMILAVLTVGCLVAGPVIAGAVDTLMQKHALNQLKPTKINVQVDENGDPGNNVDPFDPTPDPDGVVKKPVQIENLAGSVPAYIRVTLVPHWEERSAEGNVDVLGGISSSNLRGLSISGNTFTVGGITYELAQDWADNWYYHSADGCFYYRKPVAAGEKTTLLLTKVQISKEFADVYYPGKSLTIDVLTDSVQTEGGAVAKVWGSAIAAILPGT